MPKEVTKEEAKKIIKNKESIGLFYFSEEYEGITMYLGIDNSTGKAWVEAFYAKDDCFDWLNDEQKCRVCGCTWNSPCEGGCYWVEEDLCSKCAEQLYEKALEYMHQHKYRKAYKTLSVIKRT